MQGKQIFQPKLFYQVKWQELVPKNHLLRRLERVLDLGFVQAKTKSLYCEENGRPSIDPEVFFRMQIVSYLYGVVSDRQLCEEIQVNLAYRWFCRLSLEDEVPDHSSLSRIRDRPGESFFKEAFETILEQCRKAGLVPGKKVIADASLIQASASIDSLEERDIPSDNQTILKRYDRRIGSYVLGKKSRKRSNQTHQSKTDPDSSLVARPNCYNKLYHKVHYSCDATSRVITDCHVTTGARHEGQVLPERLKYQQKQLALEISEIIADRGYGRGPTYRFCREQKIRSYIPLHDDHYGEHRVPRNEFLYQKKEDRYRCPQGHYLYPYEKLTGSSRRYRILGGHCQTCPPRNSCLPDKQKHRARFLFRNPYQDLIDQV
ncbi:MAG: IS5/IS1182 family transposase [Deltaproteobacteria bacterium CG11_big_fil_rev_8_21_14_0_20_45_16]|nr:MAG: IS5/IS1182 family transposase [Deltaproteobacteria bacterium CG11_big_fil_rev_8_21_14_0_20_45_16]